MTAQEDPQRQELLEIYKLHADLADKVSQRRDSANRLHVSLQFGLGLFLSALLRFGIGDAPGELILSAVGILGIVVSGSWLIVIDSYRQLNHKKFQVLTELEKCLSFQFFTRESELATSGKERRYRELTKVETLLPWGCLLLWLGLLAYSTCLLAWPDFCWQPSGPTPVATRGDR